MHQFTEIISAIKNGKPLNFSYIRQSAGGRFEYNIRYLSAQGIFIVESKDHYIFDEERIYETNYSEEELLNFLKINKEYIS